jgi:hypothetical protein
MVRETVGDWIRSAESAAPEDQWTILCFLAGQAVSLDRDEVRAALRRAHLLLAAGGDPRRKLELHGRAVTAVARDLDSPAARAQLADGLRALEPEIAGLDAGKALPVLLRDADLAWQCFACALLAADLAD